MWRCDIVETVGIIKKRSMGWSWREVSMWRRYCFGWRTGMMSDGLLLLGDHWFFGRRSNGRYDWSFRPKFMHLKWMTPPWGLRFLLMYECSVTLLKRTLNAPIKIWICSTIFFICTWTHILSMYIKALRRNLHMIFRMVFIMFPIDCPVRLSRTVPRINHSYRTDRKQNKKFDRTILVHPCSSCTLQKKRKLVMLMHGRYALQWQKGFGAV